MFRSAYEFTVAAGHHVIDSHRHTFRIRIDCAGDLGTTGGDRGMVVDYRDLRVVERSVLRPAMQNRMFVADDEAAAAEPRGLQLTLVPFRPTVEHLAKYLYDLTLTGLGTSMGCAVERVTVWENSNCSASYEPAHPRVG